FGSSPGSNCKPGRSLPRATTGAVVLALPTRSTSQSSSPTPFMKITLADDTFRMSSGFGEYVCTSPPFGTRLVTITCVPPTLRTMSANTVVVVTTSIASGDGDTTGMGGSVGGRSVIGEPAAGPVAPFVPAGAAEHAASARQTATAHRVRTARCSIAID